MTNQTSTPTPPPGSARPESNRFFTWLRSLGVVRADGWIGGVCGGIALRTGLDPLIVRGIAVVIAILGGPALFFYAAAWLLLPDTHGEIHLERMLRGIVDAPVIVIGILVVLTFLPFTQGVWWLGGHLVGSAWWIAGPTEVLRVLWNLAVVGAIVWFIVWVVRRVRNAPTRAQQGGAYGAGAAAPASATPGAWGAPGPSGASTMSFGPAASGAPATSFAEGAPAGTVGAPAESGVPAGTGVPAENDGAATVDAASDQPSTGEAPEVPPAPGAGASKDELGEWRQRYDAWRAQHQAWQEQQRAQLQSARTARGAEMRAKSIAMAQQAEERRRARRAANPRAAGWVVAIVLGAALIAGGIAGGVAATHGDLSRYAAPIGMAVALMTIGLGMVVAGAARRRSGVLAFMAIVTLVLGLGSFGWPVHDSAVGFTQLRADRDVTFTQFAGQVEIDAAQGELGDSTRRVTVKQTFGAVAVYLGDGVRARVDVTSGGSSIRPRVRGSDGEVTTQPTIRVEPSRGRGTVERSWSSDSDGSAGAAGAAGQAGAAGSPELIVDIMQGRGAVYIYQGGGAHPNSGDGYLD